MLTFFFFTKTAHIRLQLHSNERMRRYDPRGTTYLIKTLNLKVLKRYWFKNTWLC